MIINTHEAKTQLLKLLDRVSSGEEIIIAKSGKPVAKLVPCGAKTVTLGFLEGQLRVSDDFDVPLPNDILDGFCGHPGFSDEKT